MKTFKSSVNFTSSCSFSFNSRALYWFTCNAMVMDDDFYYDDDDGDDNDDDDDDDNDSFNGSPAMQ